MSLVVAVVAVFAIAPIAALLAVKTAALCVPHVLGDLIPFIEVSPRKLQVRSDITVDESNFTVRVEFEDLVEALFFHHGYVRSHKNLD